MLVYAIDWTMVITAALVALPGLLAAWFSGRNRRDMRLPSGETIGAAVERSHDLTAVSTALLRRLNGDHAPDPPTLKEQKANGG